MSARISDNGLTLIAVSEGEKLRAYPDPGTGGVPWTIGDGHTSGVFPGETCTHEQAMAWLREDVAWAEGIVDTVVTVPLTQGQRDALDSFVFNIGAGRKGVRDGLVTLANGNPSTLLRKLNAGDYDGAAAEFPKWANPPLLGLRIRRAREQVLFKGGDWRTIKDGVEPW